MNGGEDIRRISCDDRIPVAILRDFLMATLRHEAIADVLIERMVFQVERGELDAHRLAAVLPELIPQLLDVANNEDWMAIADALIEDMRESLLEVGES